MMKRFALSGLLVGLFFAGLSSCSRDQGPPPPLAAEQIPSEFDKVFKHAKPEVKELATRVVSALQAKDYPAAFAAVQSLSAAAGATRQQQSLVARAIITVYGLLQTAQAQGDEKAAAVIQDYRSFK